MIFLTTLAPETQTVQLANASGEHASASIEVSFNRDYPELSDLVSPPPCNPGLVGPLPALAIVVTLAEALVDCLLSGEYPLLYSWLYRHADELE